MKGATYIWVIGEGLVMQGAGLERSAVNMRVLQEVVVLQAANLKHTGVMLHENLG